MPDKHLSSRFDTELNLVSTRLLEMGGLVESQIACVLEALKTFDPAFLEHVGDAERRLNLMEMKSTTKSSISLPVGSWRHPTCAFCWRLRSARPILSGLGTRHGK